MANFIISLDSSTYANAGAAELAITNSGLTITKTSLVGVAPSQDLHYSWTAQLDEVIDSASDMTFNIAVSLAQEP